MNKLFLKNFLNFVVFARIISEKILMKVSTVVGEEAKNGFFINLRHIDLQVSDESQIVFIEHEFHHFDLFTL